MQTIALSQQATGNLCTNELTDSLADAREPELEANGLAYGSANLLAHEHGAPLLCNPELIKPREHLLQCIGLLLCL